MSKKPFPALCRDCKHSMPEANSSWNLRCTHPIVNGSDEWALVAATPHGSNALDERKKTWPFGKCGKRGALWEPKAL